jgi:hypothetical protein
MDEPAQPSAIGNNSRDNGWVIDTDPAELAAARQRLVGLDAENQQLRHDMERLKAEVKRLRDMDTQLRFDTRSAEGESDRLQKAMQSPKAQPADQPLSPDPRLTEITALVHALRVDIAGLTRALQPVIVTFAELQEVSRERSPAEEPSSAVSRWQRVTCWWRGHEENVTEFTNARYEPYTRCVKCGRVYRR